MEQKEKELLLYKREVKKQMIAEYNKLLKILEDQIVVQGNSSWVIQYELKEYSRLRNDLLEDLAEMNRQLGLLP